MSVSFPLGPFLSPELQGPPSAKEKLPPELQGPDANPTDVVREYYRQHYESKRIEEERRKADAELDRAENEDDAQIKGVVDEGKGSGSKDLKAKTTGTGAGVTVREAQGETESSSGHSLGSKFRKWKGHFKH